MLQSLATFIEPGAGEERQPFALDHRLDPTRPDHPCQQSRTTDVFPGILSAEKARGCDDVRITCHARTIAYYTTVCKVLFPLPLGSMHRPGKSALFRLRLVRFRRGLEADNNPLQDAPARPTRLYILLAALLYL